VKTETVHTIGLLVLYQMFVLNADTLLKRIISLIIIIIVENSRNVGENVTRKSLTFCRQSCAVADAMDTIQRIQNPNTSINVTLYLRSVLLMRIVLVCESGMAVNDATVNVVDGF